MLSLVLILGPVLVLNPILILNSVLILSPFLVLGPVMILSPFLVLGPVLTLSPVLPRGDRQDGTDCSRVFPWTPSPCAFYGHTLGFHSQGGIRGNIRNMMRQCSGLNSVFLELQKTPLFGNQVSAGGIKLSLSWTR